MASILFGKWYTGMTNLWTLLLSYIILTIYICILNHYIANMVGEWVYATCDRRNFNWNMTLIAWIKTPVPLNNACSNDLWPPLYVLQSPVDCTSFCGTHFLFVVTFTSCFAGISAVWSSGSSGGLASHSQSVRYGVHRLPRYRLATLRVVVVGQEER